MIKCGNDDHCKVGQAWSKFILSDRIYLLKGFDLQRPVWHHVLLVVDEETISKFVELTVGANAGKNTSTNDYGQVLKSGWVNKAPNDIKKWM